MAALSDGVPQPPPLSVDRLRGVLVDASDRLRTFPGPDDVELRAIVHGVREAYADTGLQLPQLEVHIQEMLLDLQTPETFDASRHADRLSEVASQL